MSTLNQDLIANNATFNNISAISWRSVLFVEETGVTEENHRPVAIFYLIRQKVSQNLEEEQFAKEQEDIVNRRRTNNAMGNRTNNNLQNTTKMNSGKFMIDYI